jgi:hypothetical protein
MTTIAMEMKGTTQMSKEALKMALEALEPLIVERTCEAMDAGEKAITAIKEALAQPEQGEPVAQHRDLHSHMMVVAHRAADKATNNGQKFASQKEIVRAICTAIQVDKNLLAMLSTPQQKQEQGEPVAWRYKPVREDNPRWEYTTQHPLDMGDGYLRPSLVEYCKCIEPLYATEKPKLMLEKFCEMKDLLKDTVQQEPATKEQIREAIVFNLPIYTTPQQRTWVGLTPEEVKEVSLANRPYVVDMVVALEARLKQKNGYAEENT